MTTAEPPARRPRLIRRTWFHVVAALVLAVIVLASVGQPTSGSMTPTLEPGDRLLINRLAYVAAAPTPGEIVVFRPDASWDEHPAPSDNVLVSAVRWAGEITGLRPHVLVKRVIAGPGQTVECCDATGALLVDGEPLDEPYVDTDLPFTPGVLDCETTPSSLRCFDEVTVPADSYLVLGDNRANSADSAFRCRGDADAPDTCWRWVERGAVVGKASAIFWPFSRGAWL